MKDELSGGMCAICLWDDDNGDGDGDDDDFDGDFMIGREYCWWACNDANFAALIAEHKLQKVSLSNKS